MRYANLNWQSTGLNDSKRLTINFGDNLQYMAIDNLYSFMGIPKEEIFYLSIAEMVSYAGEEKLILPLNWAIFDSNWMVDGRICISEKIIPVFLAMTLGCAYQEAWLNEDNIQYLKRYEPIGCRDAETYRVLSGCGIKAYLNGCLTALFPKRKSEPKEGKVFFDDVPVEISEYVPREYMEEGVFITQQYYYSDDLSADELENIVKRHYGRIVDEAKLVITSRLHVASPCMALGIPVIFVKKVVDSRFGWLEKYIPLYAQEIYSEIDWNPKALDYEKEKQCILELNKNRILAEKYRVEIQEKMMDYYGEQKNSYISFAQYIRHNWTGVKKFIRQNWDKKREIRYAIWGLTVTVDELVDYIEQEYPNAKLERVFDAYKTGTYRNLPIENPEDIENVEYYLFALSVGASNQLYGMCTERHIPMEKIYMVGDVYIRQRED